MSGDGSGSGAATPDPDPETYCGRKWKPMRTPWFRCDARIGEDPRIAKLSSDSERWAFILTLGKAKEQRPEGSFPSPDHLRAALGRHGRYVSALLTAGLLHTTEAGAIAVVQWSEWQSNRDLSTPRVVAFRARKRSETA